MTDLTEIFLKGTEMSSGYKPFDIIVKLNRLDDILCDLDDDGANWNAVWRNIDKKTVFDAFFSRFYPVAIVKKDCPESVIQCFKNNNILIAEFKINIFKN